MASGVEIGWVLLLRLRLYVEFKTKAVVEPQRVHVVERAEGSAEEVERHSQSRGPLTGADAEGCAQVLGDERLC